MFTVDVKQQYVSVNNILFNILNSYEQYNFTRTSLTTYIFVPYNAIGGARGGNILNRTGPGCSKLTTSLVNVSLKFQTLISQIGRYFLSKKFVKLLHCKSFSHFFNKKFQCIWV